MARESQPAERKGNSARRAQQSDYRDDPLDVDAEQAEPAEDPGDQAARVGGRKNCEALQHPVEAHDSEEGERRDPSSPDAERQEQEGSGLPEEDAYAARAQRERVAFDREAAFGPLMAAAVVADEVEGV